MVSSGASDIVSAPEVTLTVGSPNRFASAGARMGASCPLPATVSEPSGYAISRPGPEMFSVIAFPVCRFVYEAVREPVMSVVTDPSELLRTLPYSRLTGKDTPIGNPQKSAGRVNGAAG